MRTSLILIWFLLAASLCVTKSQEKQLFGFDELDWGSTRVEVKDFMESKFNISPGYEKDDAIGYQGGNYFGQDIFLWVYFFDAEGLEETDLVIQNTDRPLGPLFSETIHKLAVTYGDPDLYKPDDWDAEWFYYDFPGKHLKAAIRVSPWSDEKMSSIKISFLKSDKLH